MTVGRIDTITDLKERRAGGRGLLPDGGPYLTGLLVDSVHSWRPAAAAGIEPGDVLLDIDGRRLVNVGDYFAALGPVHVPGKALAVTVYRPLPRVTGLKASGPSGVALEGSAAHGRSTVPDGGIGGLYVDDLPDGHSHTTGREGTVFTVTLRPEGRPVAGTFRA